MPDKYQLAYLTGLSYRFDWSTPDNDLDVPRHQLASGLRTFVEQAYTKTRRREGTVKEIQHKAKESPPARKGIYIGGHHPRPQGPESRWIYIGDKPEARKGDSGLFDCLPREILDLVLSKMDVCSLKALRFASSKTMYLIDTLPTYDELARHCPGVVNIIARLECRSYSVETLFQTLRGSKCTRCKHFGGYLYLITCRRLCYTCFITEEEYLPVTALQGTELAGLSKHALDMLPSALSVPGKYGHASQVFSERIHIFDHESVAEAMILEPTSPKMSEIFLRKDRKEYEGLRFLAIATAPWIDTTRGGQSVAEWGTFCAICRSCSDWRQGRHRRIQRTKDEVFAHLLKHHQLIRELMDGDVRLLRQIATFQSIVPTRKTLQKMKAIVEE